MNQLTHPKFCLLVNCNAPSEMGNEAFERMVRNLDLLIKNFYMKSRITLGINMFKPDFEYQYIIRLLLRYGFDHVRTSITVPRISNNQRLDPIEYFSTFKKSVRQFFLELFNHSITPNYDCNIMPSCLLDTQEVEQMKEMFKKEGNQTNISGEYAVCSPVIDIMPDLKAVRCFGLSNYEKASIQDFHHIQEIKNFFLNRFDHFAFNTSASHNCVDCQKRKTSKCFGGCLFFKIDQINALKDYSDQLLSAVQL